MLQTLQNPNIKKKKKKKILTGKLGWLAMCKRSELAKAYDLPVGGHHHKQL